MKRSSVVYIKFPKAGLGNMLLTWSRGFVFSQINGLKMQTSGWTAIHYGAWFRREKRKRLYTGYFRRNSFFDIVRFRLSLLTRRKVTEPCVKKINLTYNNNSAFVFNKIFTDYDFFNEIRPYKALVKEGIINMLTSSVKKKYDKAERPVIGIHIRRGDFKKGSILTPVSFFINVINTLRRESKEDLPVTIFTDGESSEIKELTDLEAVKISPPLPDILDILLLSESKIAILSIGSTFSYWAGFLSEGIVIKHKREWHVPFRSVADHDFSKEKFWEC